jgi:hypothetical protein
LGRSSARLWNKPLLGVLQDFRQVRLWRHGMRIRDNDSGRKRLREGLRAKPGIADTVQNV